MFEEGNVIRRPHSNTFNRADVVKVAEYVETESIFLSIEERMAWMLMLDQMKLRNRLVWFGIASFAVEILLVFLHSASMIVLPEAVIISVSVLMGGSSFGLGSLLYFIARDLFRNR